MVNYTVIRFIVYTICEMRNNLRNARTVLVSLSSINAKLDRK